MTPLNEMTPAAVAEALHRHEITLIDVREPNEYGAERIHGALLYPLSAFDPLALPADGRKLVFHCGSGKRSATAVQRCQAAGIALDTHMAGGIAAWKRAGLPVIALSPATGHVIDRR